MAARKETAATAVKKRVTRKKAAVTQAQIAERAYYLHLERGGDELENWLSAERELVTT